MLTLDLRALETAGLVTRTVYPTKPVRVEYALTENGMRLKAVVAAVHDFGLWLKQHRPAVVSDRTRAGRIAAELGSSPGLHGSRSTDSPRSEYRAAAG